jgi:hypothetical protein
MANIGPFAVPAPLEKYLPYAKGVVAVAGVVATILLFALATPPGWVSIIVTAVTALGVFTVPNSNIKALLVDGQVVVSDAEAAAAAVRQGNAVDARSDVTQAFKAVDGAVTQVSDIAGDVKKAV